MSIRKSLGLVKIEEGTFAHDVTLLDRYLSYSAELLRLSLLGITAIAYWVSKASSPPLPPITRGMISISLLAFAASAATALVHRYAATDSMSSHLEVIRRYIRNSTPSALDTAKDVAIEAAERSQRSAQFRRSKLALAVSAILLGIGSVFLAFGALLLLW